jgi:hypothetical protein
VLFSVSASPVLAQQTVDRYSIPAKSTCRPAELEGRRRLTHAERTYFAETSSYAVGMRFIDSL